MRMRAKAQFPEPGADMGGGVLKARLGAGGFGTVYLGERGGQSYALKLVPLEGLDRWGERELLMLARVRHPNAVRLLGHSYWPDASPRFLVVIMEYVEGRPLGTWAREENPSARRVVRAVLGVARALSAVHAARAVHRDVKEANVLVREADGEAVLVDFGVGTYEGSSGLGAGTLPPGTRAYLYALHPLPRRSPPCRSPARHPPGAPAARGAPSRSAGVRAPPDGGAPSGAARGPQEAVPQVCISPGQPTFIDFGEAYEPGSVALEGEERFALVEPARSSLKLVPSERLRPGERLRLTVRFPGTAAPANATLLLVVHAAVAEPLLYVHRMARAADSYRQELAAAKEEARRCHEANARLRAEMNLPGGLAGLLASGVLGRESMGVLAADLTGRAQWLPSSALHVNNVLAYRARARAAILLVLTGPVGAAWTAEGATLAPAGRQGEALKVLTVWQSSPIARGDFGTLVVEVEVPAKEPRGPFLLKLWEAGGVRTVTLSGVTFP